jgi:hypothetical protein
MIGGQDIRFGVASGAIALDFAVRLVAQWWPEAVFALDDDPETVTHFSQLSFHDRSEVIIYRDAASSDAWDELGYDDSLRGTMVYLISDPKHLTLVTEHEPCDEIVAMIAAIKGGLSSAFPVGSREAA